MGTSTPRFLTRSAAGRRARGRGRPRPRGRSGRPVTFSAVSRSIVVAGVSLGSGRPRLVMTHIGALAGLLQPLARMPGKRAAVTPVLLDVADLSVLRGTSRGTSALIA